MTRTSVQYGFTRLITAALLLVTALPGTAESAPATSTDTSASAAAPPPAPPSDRLDPLINCGSPHSAVQGFLAATRKTRYRDAVRYLDLSQIPEPERARRGPRLARELKVVLDQKLWIDFEKLSDECGGKTDDGLSPDRDRIGVIETSRGAFEIALKRVQDEGARSEWRFSPGTLEDVEALYSEIGYGALLDWIPYWATGMRIGNVEGWQWVAFLLLIALAVGVSRVLTSTIYVVVRMLSGRTEAEFREGLLETIRPPVRLISAMGLVALGSHWLRLSMRAQQTLGKIAIGLLIALVAWGLMRLIDLAVSRTVEKLRSRGRRSGVSTLVLLRRLGKGIVIGVAVLAMLQNIGFNVTGLLAGFGLAGAAIALAAQKTIENVFGGLVLTIDEPVRIGDTCRFGGTQGTIEDIGLRSTRVRTLDRTVISVPNAEMSAIQIENFAMRDRIRLLTMLQLRYDTTQEQLTAILAALRELLEQDRRIASDDRRVRFVALGAYSLDIEVMAYILTVDYPTFLEIREELFLRFMTIVSENGAGFAFPSQTLYMARDTPGDTVAAE